MDMLITILLALRKPHSKYVSQEQPIKNWNWSNTELMTLPAQILQKSIGAQKFMSKYL